MFSAIRRRMHVSPTTVIASLALVFAMTGGAYAASKVLITSTKQISPKVLKSLQGKAGAAGVPGAPGSAGPQGPAGVAGAKGETGSQGPEGKEGKQGTPGANGQTGFTATLPSGKTLKGQWSLYAEVPGQFRKAVSSVSFGIPLAEAPVPHYIRANGKEPFYNTSTKTEEEREQVECPGSAASPEAKPGNLCVYASSENDVEPNLAEIGSPQSVLPKVMSFEKGGLGEFEGPSASGKNGFGLTVFAKEAGAVEAVGAWAVTAE